MAAEIERKFLVAGDSWRAAEGMLIRQSYLCVDEQRTVRVRIAGDRAFLTIKGPTHGLTREEFEYPIPLADARQLLELCVAAGIEKIRRRIPHEGLTWEVDEFLGANAGLVIAEVELGSAGQTFSRPAWVGEEVTHDARYCNSNLAVHPWSTWSSGMCGPS